MNPGAWGGDTAVTRRPGTFPLKRKGALGLIVRPLSPSYSRIVQFLRDQASDSEEVVMPLKLDRTYQSMNLIGKFVQSFLKG